MQYTFPGNSGDPFIQKMRLFIYSGICINTDFFTA